jgi:hypothetical protein
MPSNLNELLNDLLKDTTGFAKDELIGYINDAKNDTSDFVKRIGKLAEKNIQRLALGKITADEFKELMEDLLDLNKMELNKLSSDAKVKAQKTISGISNLALNKLLSIIK